MPPTEFAPGFRISSFDIAILTLGTCFAVIASWVRVELGIFFTLPLTHFFLFCNVFRIARELELVWACGFIVLSVTSIATNLLWWPTAAFLALGLGALVIIQEMRKPSYHGIGWQRINPSLRQWWGHQSRVRIETECP